MTVGNDALQTLIESGVVTEDMSVGQIAEALAKVEAGEAPTAPTPVTTVPPVEQPVVTEPPAAKVETPTPPTSSSVPPAAEVEAPVLTPSGQQIPYGVLRGTREQRDRAISERDNAVRELNALQERHRTEVAALQANLTTQQQAPTPTQVQKVQQAADRAGFRDEEGNVVDVATVDIAQYRGQYPSELLNLIGGLQHEIVRLRGSEVTRQQHERMTDQQREQADIDAVPAVAAWQADADPTMWNALNGAYKGLRTQDAWKDKSRVEVLQEVARRLGGSQQAPQHQTPVTPGTNVSAQIAAAQAKAAPLSHSDLPAGSPPAQSEQEALENMDSAAIAQRMKDMTPEQQDELLRRYG